MVEKKGAVYRTRDKKRTKEKKPAASCEEIPGNDSGEKIHRAERSHESSGKRKRELSAFHAGSRIAHRDRFNYALAGCTINCVRGVHGPECALFFTTLKKVDEDHIPMILPENTPPTECQNSRTLRSLFRQVQKLLEVEQGLARAPYGRTITCGELRKALESAYGTLTIVQSLSVKTAQKLEPQPCEYCREHFALLVDEWKGKRKLPQVTDVNHLSRFRKAFSQNIRRGWNEKFRRPFVPNGHGSLHHRRREGGNWNEEEFSSDFRTELVFSSGKPRVVTLYSSRNTTLLKPLHSALFGHIYKRKWLLVGPPTEERISTLKGGAYESFDYKSATDNIKVEYVRAAVDELIQKGVGLTYEEVEALRVVSDLTVDGELCGSGQPMGSLMSFPLLCLINKTMVDLALVDTLTTDGVNFSSKEAWETFQRHMSLINGDDLALREPTGARPGEFRKWLVYHGGHVGLCVNEEKSMTSVDWLEINSTAFFQGALKKKTNVGVLRNKKTDVGDAIGIAKDATITPSGFRYVLRANVKGFALQTHKHVRKHPDAIAFICRNKPLQSALKMKKKLNTPFNPFPVCETPDGFKLSDDEVFRALEDEVCRVRPRVLANLSSVKEDELTYNTVVTSTLVPDANGGECVPALARDYEVTTVNKVLRSRPTPARDQTLVCLVDFWKEKKIKKMVDLEISRPDVWTYETVQTNQAARAYARAQLKNYKNYVSHEKKTILDVSLNAKTPVAMMMEMIRTARALGELKTDRPNSRMCVDPLTGDHTLLEEGTDVENLPPSAPCGAFRFGAGVDTPTI